MIYRESLDDGITKMKSSDKHFIWVKLDKYVFHLNDDIYLCGTYIPPENSVYFKDENDTTVLHKLREDISIYSNLGKILIIGDLNSRVGLSIEQLSHIMKVTQMKKFFSQLIFPAGFHWIGIQILQVTNCYK